MSTTTHQADTPAQSEHTDALDSAALAAVETFREVARVEYLLNRKQQAHRVAVARMAIDSPIEARAAYVEVTNEIEAFFVAKKVSG